MRPIVALCSRSRPLRLVLAAGLLATSTGCVVAAAGYGTYKVKRNGDAREYEVPFEPAWVAAGDAMRESGYPVDARPPQGPSEGAYEFQDVRAGVFKVTEGRTRVEVTVGTFDNADNRRRARLVLDAISRRLGYTPPS